MDQMNIRHYALVEAADGPVGRVKHLVVDPQTHEATDLVITSDGRQWLVPIGAVTSVQGDRVVLQGPWSDYESKETVSHEVFRPLKLSQAGGVSGATSATVAEASPPGGTWRVQLREERLRVDKQREQAGSVRVGKRVTERVETVDVPVREERLIIEHRPGNGQVTVGGKPLQDGESIEVPVMRERVVVRKEPVVVEEVTLRKEVIEHTEHAQETVRKEELVVDDKQGLSVGPARNGPGPAAASGTLSDTSRAPKE